MFPFSCLFLLIYIFSEIAPFIFLQEKKNRNLFLCFLYLLISTRINLFDLSTNTFLKFLHLFSVFHGRSFHYIVSSRFSKKHLYLHPKAITFPSQCYFTIVVHHFYSNLKHSFRFIFTHIHSKSTTFSSFTVFLQERNSKKSEAMMFSFCLLCFLLSFTVYNIIYIHLFQTKEKERSEMFSLCDYNIIYIHFTFYNIIYIY